MCTSQPAARECLDDDASDLFDALECRLDAEALQAVVLMPSGGDGAAQAWQYGDAISDVVEQQPREHEVERSTGDRLHGRYVERHEITLAMSPVVETRTSSAHVVVVGRHLPMHEGRRAVTARHPRPADGRRCDSQLWRPLDARAIVMPPLAALDGRVRVKQQIERLAPSRPGGAIPCPPRSRRSPGTDWSGSSNRDPVRAEAIRARPSCTAARARLLEAFALMRNPGTRPHCPGV